MIIIYIVTIFYSINKTGSSANLFGLQLCCWSERRTEEMRAQPGFEPLNPETDAIKIVHILVIRRPSSPTFHVQFISFMYCEFRLTLGLAKYHLRHSASDESISQRLMN